MYLDNLQCRISELLVSCFRTFLSLVKLVTYNADYHRLFFKDALLLSIDHHGFDVLAKLPEREITALDVPQQYHWKEFRFPFKEAAKDVEDFCRMLVELEQEALHSVKSYSGLG